MRANLPELMDVVSSRFGQPKVLVVGDLMLDKYVWGEVERISPEAPVPVLRTGRHSEQPGGAANVAMNLAGLGARVTVMGFGGGDDDQSRLESLLRDWEKLRATWANTSRPTMSARRKVPVRGHPMTEPVRVSTSSMVRFCSCMRRTAVSMEKTPIRLAMKLGVSRA